ncbi:MAG: methyltransferase domain-containing protein [Gammaproteobacteria bacterium]|nr:methyltransferase domain-containing protein [Gammaproteobacteria bacterium]MYC25957.1 methyltransferase domain-containing protein [Gammaproteobacteria bacterium]
MKPSDLLKLPKNLRESYGDLNVSDSLKRYESWLERREQAKKQDDTYDHTETVSEYYDLFTELMQFGWNESLHFAPISQDESLEEAIIRHQRQMIKKLELEEGMKVIDVGCGLGGPMRRVAKESGAKVLGINNNEHQLEQAKQKTTEAGLDHVTEFHQCNFMDMSCFEANSFDAGYAIESTCYAPIKERAFAEIFNVLKPGALFWGQEMCLTNVFDPDDQEHCAIRDEIKFTLALCDLFTFEEVNRSLENVGFEIIEAKDHELNDGSSVPWYQPMDGLTSSLRSWLRVPAGRTTLASGVRMAEVVGMFPKDSWRVIELLDRQADAYVAGGQSGIYTPLYCFLAQKPARN